MEILLIWVGLSVAVGVLAAARDRAGFGWFLLALIISPLIAGLFLLIAGQLYAARCPFCAEKIKGAARICPHCRCDIVAPVIQIEGETKRRSFWNWQP